MGSFEDHTVSGSKSAETVRQNAAFTARHFNAL
jgi:hypothetical protein